MFKKTASLALCLFLLFSLSIPSFAATPIDAEHNFSITEITNAHGQVTRTYIKSSQPARSNTNPRCFSPENTLHSETKALLSTLGMDAKTIENMSDAELDHYSAANTIISTVSYLKTSPDGITSYVDEETALTEASKINQSQVFAIPPSSYDDIVAEKTITDSYMILTYVLSWVTSDLYHHSVTAALLTSPKVSAADSLGICAQEHTVIPSSCEGTISYDCATLINGVQTNLVHYSHNFDNFMTPSNPSIAWGGAAAVFDIPSNRLSYEYSTTYSGVVMTFKANTRPTYPNLESYFLSTATYSTSYSAVENVELSLSVSVVSISLAGDNDEAHTVCFDTPIHHIP